MRIQPTTSADGAANLKIQIEVEWDYYAGRAIDAERFRDRDGGGYSFHARASLPTEYRAARILAGEPEVPKHWPDIPAAIVVSRCIGLTIERYLIPARCFRGPALAPDFVQQTLERFEAWDWFERAGCQAKSNPDIIGDTFKMRGTS